MWKLAKDVRFKHGIAKKDSPCVYAFTNPDGTCRVKVSVQRRGHCHHVILTVPFSAIVDYYNAGTKVPPPRPNKSPEQVKWEYKCQSVKEKQAHVSKKLHETPASFLKGSWDVPLGTANT